MAIHPVALFLLAVFIAVLLLVAAMIAFLCSRPPQMPQFTPRVWYTSKNESEMGHSHSTNRLSRLPSYASNLSNLRRDSSFIAGGARGSLGMHKNASESFKNDTISVSPSQPVIIGSESQKGGAVKLMITPPTPSKANFGLDSNLKMEGLEFCHREDVLEDDDSDETACSTSESAFKPTLSEKE
ncbi:hypothetical protein AN958_02418 [Leucoagaricus sp. SymC.cos]|nr:hypothetical protein AN958_02418 [Leucoagaricus sp. SymC.cos]